MPRRPTSLNAPKRTTSNLRHTVGANIKARRLTLGWSQQELADQFGVSRATVSQYEIGTGEVNAGDLPRLADVLGIGLLEFFGQPPPVYALGAKPDISGKAATIDSAMTIDPAIGEQLHSSAHRDVVYLRDKDNKVAYHIGWLPDFAPTDGTVLLLRDILGLSPEHTETVRRVVDAMHGKGQIIARSQDESEPVAQAADINKWSIDPKPSMQ